MSHRNGRKYYTASSSIQIPFVKSDYFEFIPSGYNSMSHIIQKSHKNWGSRIDWVGHSKLNLYLIFLTFVKVMKISNVA